MSFGCSKDYRNISWHVCKSIVKKKRRIIIVKYLKMLMTTYVRVIVMLLFVRSNLCTIFVVVSRLIGLVD